jgi:hypothetical protein
MPEATAAPAPMEDLIEDLRRMTEQLWTESPSQIPGEIHLPSLASLTELRRRVLHLSDKLPPGKNRSPVPWAALERVESKIPELRLGMLITGWVQDFSTLPVSPVQLWNRRVAQKQLERNADMQQLLDGLSNLRLPPADLLARLHSHWGDLYPLASKEFRIRFERCNFAAASLKPDNQAPRTEVFSRWSLVTDLLAQQADWHSRFGRFDRFPSWVAAWQNDDLTAKIQEHLLTYPKLTYPKPDPHKQIVQQGLVQGRRRIHRHRGSGNFEAGDILDLETLADKLRLASDPVAAFIVSRMSVLSRGELSSLGSTSTGARQLESTLLQELTRISCGPCIYNPERFMHVSLRPETRRRLGSKEVRCATCQTIKPGTLENAPAVAKALKSPTNKAVEFLFEKLSLGTREALDDWDGQDRLPRKTEKAICGDLNAIILGPSIWDPPVFADVVIPWPFMGWLDFDVAGPQIAQRNRLLLEQILPLHRAKGHLQVPLPPVVAFRKSLFRLNRILIEDAFPGEIRSTGGKSAVELKAGYDSPTAG